jgi:hypothetical protein
VSFARVLGFRVRHGFALGAAGNNPKSRRFEALKLCIAKVTIFNQALIDHYVLTTISSSRVYFDREVVVHPGVPLVGDSFVDLPLSEDASLDLTPTHAVDDEG